MPCSALLAPLAGSLQHLQLCDWWASVKPFAALMALTSLIALALRVPSVKEQPGDRPAIAHLSGLQRLTLHTKQRSHWEGMHAAAGNAVYAVLSCGPAYLLQWVMMLKAPGEYAQMPSWLRCSRF